jgi:hypothetical protein
VHVIDEAAISTLVERTKLTDGDIAVLGELLGVDLIAELKPPGRLLTALADKNLTPDALRTLAQKKAITEAREGYVLNPACDDETLQKEIGNLKPFRRLAPILERLADELASGRGGAAYSLILQDGKVISQGRRQLPAKKVLLLDATGNAVILRQFFRDLEEATPLKVRRNARVKQVSDRTFSRSQLLKNGKATKLLEEANRFIALKAFELKKQGGRLLVVTDRRARALLTGESEEELKRPSGRALGADIAHFGNLRGSNNFEEHAAVIILGRDQPKGEDAVQLAQAIWYDTPEPIKLAKRDARGRINYTEGERNHQMRDGSTCPGKVSIQPDERVQAVVEQVREGGMTQAIDRLRLIHNTEPKDVFILSSIPLDIEVGRLVTWEELAGNHRLNKLLDTCAAEGLDAVPLTPTWLVEKKLFRNPKSAENWLRHSQVVELAQKSSNPENAIKSIVMGKSGLFGAEAEGDTWEPKVATWRLVEYRPAGRRGKWSNALVCGLDARVAISGALGLSESAIELREPA